jgi:polyribonucleotide nucleotidyltransferase
MMDAGVPIKAPVAGIAMGLIHADDKYVTLTDILGAEDAFGDMDFKVAGTSEFITALQLDTKIDGIPADVLAAALDQAREARLSILETMAGAIAEPRDEVAETAPKIISFEIPIDKIGEVIGPKGKVINAIQAETGANISVDDDGMVGTVAIASVDAGAMAEAERQIKLILDPPTAEVGATYEGRVVNITKFGAFVNILPGRDGLLHISKLGGGKRIDRVEDVVDLGDAVTVRVDDIDPNGKISLALVGDDSPKASEGGADGVAHSAAPAQEAAGSDDAPAGNRRELSFAESFDAELTEAFGDLGPAPVRSGGANRGGDRGGRGGQSRGGSGGGGRRRR